MGPLSDVTPRLLFFASVLWQKKTQQKNSQLSPPSVLRSIFFLPHNFVALSKTNNPRVILAAAAAALTSLLSIKK
jgi:hypothetical protein